MRLPFRKIASRPGLARILWPFSIVLLLAFVAALALVAIQ